MDFGSLGPLVHFIERFFKTGYEAELEKFLSRQPTSHAVWMFNRVINGTKDATERAQLIGTLKGASVHQSANKVTKDSTLDFIEWLAS